MSSPPPEPTRPTDLSSLEIRRWHDPQIDRLGHDPRSRYAERNWLGILGPSTTLLLRLLADALDEHGDAVSIDLTDTAARLGLGHRGGRNSPLARSILRACRFGAARMAGRTELEVRHRLPPLNRAQVERLPVALRADHQRLLEHGDGDAGMQARARRLALGLIECGDGFDEAERHVGQWCVPGPVAADAVNWAWERHRWVSERGPDAA